MPHTGPLDHRWISRLVHIWEHNVYGERVDIASQPPPAETLELERGRRYVVGKGCCASMLWLIQI